VPKRTFLITGGTKGIGRACVEMLSEKGHTAIALARRPPKGDFPGVFFPIDLSHREATDSLLASIAENYHLDGVVNNVGLVRPRGAEAVSLEDFDAVMDLNMRTALQAMQAALPSMQVGGFGRVVNVASLVVLGVAKRTAYAAAKAGLISFTRTWALEFARQGITVNCVAPGPIETDLFLENNPKGSEAYENFMDMIPTGRIGTPEDVARAVMFFLDEDADWITGQTLHVDGGSSIGKSAF
jgi:NAD(P)-dependent dehydrogenase (short-subunit alcohol dehydrogenase family)